MAANRDLSTDESTTTSGPEASVMNISDVVSDYYNMSHEDRGYAVVINNREFTAQGLGRRNGTDIDARKIFSLIEKLGFKKQNVKRYFNATAKKMKQALVDASKYDYSKSDCFICVILTHGSDEGCVYGTDKTVEIQDLVAPFKGNKCPSLSGKPKIFLIQACRGLEIDVGVVTDHDAGADVDSDLDSDDGVEQYRIPVESDFLLAFSSVPGHLAWRDNTTGSWFIESAHEVISKYWQQEDLLSMMTRVNKKVAYDYERNKLKQMPCITTMLTKKMFFAQKH